MRILIIDDEQTLRKGIIYLIDQLNRDTEIVGESANGQDGVNKLKLLQPDYVFIDIRMPKKDGIEVVEEWYKKKLSPKTKCIILTAHSEFEYAQKALRFGVSDFLLKPIDEHVLDDLFNRLEKSDKTQNSLTPEIGSQLIKEYITRKRITHPLIIEVLQFIGKNYMKNIQQFDIGEKFHVTHNYISTQFKISTGEHYSKFLNSFRIEISKYIMESNPTFKMNEIAYMVGFNNAAYFNRIFKSHTGFTPTGYLRKTVNNNSGILSK